MSHVRDRKVILAEIGILFVAMFWGMGFVSGKFVLEDMGPFNLMAYRYGLAFIVMGICSVPHLKKMNRKTLVAGSLIGSLMFVGNMLQTIGLQYTTPGKQTFIICMYTVLVPLLSFMLFKEKIKRNMAVAALIAFAGIGMLTLKSDLTIGFGDGLTFIFAITFSMHVILVGRFMKDGIDAFAFTLTQIGACAVLSIISAALWGDGTGLSDLHMGGIIGMAQLVLLNTTLAFILQNICQKIAPASHVAILMSTETVFGTFFAVVFADEVFTGRMIIGCILMFVALAVSNIPEKKQVSEN